MKITIISVGKLRERFYADAAAEYIKRLGKYAGVSIVEVDDGAADRMADRIPAGSFVTALAVDGLQLSSEQLAGFFVDKTNGGESRFTFLIGGADGLPDAVLNRSAYRLSLSRMTFPHQMVRVILLEQLYRAFKIIKGEPYHK
jgi:23S rRNA (pseudouridine1915-N3)-methyltransferase